MIDEHLLDEERIISKKASYYLNCTVHIKLKNGVWENGYIKEVGAEFLILTLSDEGKLKRSREEMVFFFAEIKDIENFQTVNA